MKHKHVFAIDIVLIAGTLLVLAGLIGYSRPLVIAPLPGFVTADTSVLFEFEKADLILIDDNPDFTSPDRIYAEDNLVINLKPGVYYWKVQGIAGTESEIRELTILSEVNLKLKQVSEGMYEVVNAGNVELDVEVYDDKEIVGNIVLGIDESKKASGIKFIGSQKG